MIRRQKVITLVQEDLLMRSDIGTRKYGEPLRTFNGRSALQDAYEEALDLAMYLKQAIVEKESEVVLEYNRRIESTNDD